MRDDFFDPRCEADVEANGSLKIEEWMFRFAEIKKWHFCLQLKQSCASENETPGPSAEVAVRHLLFREFTDGSLACDVNVGELEKGGQVTKGVWGMSWR